jgi:hypothetical protein
VNNYEFYNILARVRNEAYGFFLARTGQRPKGPDSLYSPFNPLHPLYRLFIDAQQVETIETLSKSQYTLLVQREPSPHGEQRIVFDNDLPLAIAIVDTSDHAGPDFTLGWPISGANSLLGRVCKLEPAGYTRRHETQRTDKHAMEAAPTAASASKTSHGSTCFGPSTYPQRHLVDSTYRCPMAGCAHALGLLEHRGQPLLSLAKSRSLATSL